MFGGTYRWVFRAFGAASVWLQVAGALAQSSNLVANPVLARPLPPHMARMWEFFGFAGDAPDPFAALELAS